MMTVDELRIHKQELLVRKKYELELQERGEGSSLNLFMINEELLDVNNHLKALTADRPKTPKTYDVSDYTKNRQQYLDWRREDTALNDEIEDGRARMRQTAAAGLDLLPPRQRELLGLYISGKTIASIAEDLGLYKSTVSRTITRAKKAIRDETERDMAANRLLAGSQMVDLRNPAAAKTVLQTLTSKQAAYFYLRYSQGLTLQKISMLTGKNRATIVRTICRALQNIDTLFGGREAVLEHPEALDEMAYQTYCLMEGHLFQKSDGRPHCPPPVHGVRSYNKLPPPISSMHVRIRQKPRGKAKLPTGKLLSVLLARQEMEDGAQVFLWLEAVFATLLAGLRKDSPKLPHNRRVT